ncbi:MAG: nitrogen fixation protein NifQ [Pseudomonadota bacterium]
MIRAQTSRSQIIKDEAYWFTLILLGQRKGISALPAKLGLNDLEFAALISTANEIEEIAQKSYCISSSNTREELLELRLDECKELIDLLTQHTTKTTNKTLWMAKVIAVACMGSHHLWQDLGLPDRESLSELMDSVFPSLAAKNSKNMRWKKFLYRQLCEEGGHFICRSPSCETCPTYNECFGDEI